MTAAEMGGIMCEGATPTQAFAVGALVVVLLGLVRLMAWIVGRKS